MSAAEGRNLTKKFGKLRAVDELTFTLAPEKIIGLIGRNGAGKTTLLKMIAGYLLPDEGDIKVFSEDPFNSIRVSANLIFIDDYPSLPASMNLADILKTAETFYAHWDQRLAAALLEYFKLPAGQSYDNLSKGMKSTFNIILGIAAHCPLTIFDEPTTGMDAAVRKDFYRALLKDYLQHPRTIILSSHLLNELEDILDEVLLIDEGRKKLHLPVHDLKEYAIGVQGREKDILEFTGDTEIYARKELGKDSVYLAVRHIFSPEELEQARINSLKISPLSAAETCVYITAKDKGGIDRVFE